MIAPKYAFLHICEQSSEFERPRAPKRHWQKLAYAALAVDPELVELVELVYRDYDMVIYSRIPDFAESPISFRCQCLCSMIQFVRI